MVILEFPTIEEGKTFFASEAYQEIAVDRDAGGQVNAVMIPAFSASQATSGL